MKTICHNEAALLAARKNHDAVLPEDFEDAKEKVMLGPERRSRVFTEKQKREIAYHEEQLEGPPRVFFDLESTTAIKGLMVTNSYTPNFDTHDFWNDIGANEVGAGSGYSPVGCSSRRRTCRCRARPGT